MDTFDSTKESLSGLLAKIHEGKVQLPDFQRGWVWDDAHIQSLIASVSRSFPIGAVMMLETGNQNVRFKPRPVEGVHLEQPVEPERLILDGQQRLTSLYQALVMNQPVRTKTRGKKDVLRWYYIDIEQAVDPMVDREDTIIAVPEDRVIRNFRGEVISDYSTRELEHEHGVFPLGLIFDVVKVASWGMEYIMSGHGDLNVQKNIWDRFLSEVVQAFQQYHLPIIELGKATEKEAVCLVFEKVNTGGVSLTVFELLTASFAADDFNLRDDWHDRVRRIVEHPILQAVSSTDFLQAVTLVSRYKHRHQAAISCKKSDVLRLTLDDYLDCADEVEEGFVKAAKLLHRQRLFSKRDLPYNSQLVPLAAILSIMGDEADSDANRTMIGRWFWCGVFGELYGSSTESRFAKDLPEVIDWLRGGSDLPTTIRDSNFMPERLETLRTRNSAAYKGLHSLLIRDGAHDFLTGDSIDVQTYYDENIDIHHVFPRAYCEQVGISPQDYNSILNKTPLSSKTNRIIGGKAPSQYLDRLERNYHMSAVRLNEILESHAIEPKFLREDDYLGFVASRRTILLRRIEQATGKPVIQEIPSHLQQGVDDYDELEDLYENVAD